MANNKITVTSKFSVFIIVLGYLYLVTGLPLQVWGDSDFILSKKYTTTEAGVVGLILGIIFGSALLLIGYSLKNLTSKQIDRAKNLLMWLIFTLFVIGAYWASDFALISIINLVVIIVAIVKYRKLKS